MKLADLIDLEAQLARDREADPASLGARDRALLIGARADTAEVPRQELLSRWLAALRDREPGRAWPGQRVEGALRTTRALLVLAGLALGWAASTALLRGGGPHPVNVWDFLLALVGVQLVLLALLLASFFLPLATAGAPLAGLVRGGVAALVRRLAGPARSAEWRALWHRLRSRRSLYHHVEPWLLLGTTQAFGVAFNVGALVAFLRLVTFSDLSFAWSTTLLDLDARTFQSLARAIAAPWATLWPDAVPTLDLVERTRYSHLESAYLWPGVGRAARPEAVGGWWPFLAAALACYGLAPRLALLALSSWRARRALRRLPLDDAEVARVARRLAEPHVETRAPTPEGAVPLAPDARLPASPTHAPAARAAILRWRDAPASVASAVARQASCASAEPASVNGAPLGQAIGEAEVVIVLAESWEAPDKATLRFLRDLRAAAGPGRHVIVVLLDTAAGTPRAPGGEELRIWREQLAALEDPWLAVEPYAEAS